MESNIIKYKTRVLIISFLQIIDFLITWIGINELSYIEEYNPLLENLFNISFEKALLYRSLFILSLSILHFIYCIYDNNGYKSKILFIFMLVVNIIIMIKHFIWVISYSNMYIIDYKGYSRVIIFISFYIITIYNLVINFLYKNYNVEKVVKYLSNTKF